MKALGYISAQAAEKLRKNRPVVTTITPWESFDTDLAILDSQANDPAIAAIEFALQVEKTGYRGDGVEFLRLWNEGEFSVIRREWPEAPKEIYINADPHHRED